MSRVAALRRLYSRRQAITMMIALGLGTGALVHASSLLAVRDPPPVATEPVVSIVLNPYRKLGWMRDSTYTTRVTIAGCRNPATVQVEALINGKDVGQPSAVPGYVHGEVVDPLGKVGHLTVLETPPSLAGQNWRPARRLFVRRTGDKVLFGAPLREWYPSQVMIGMASADTIRAVLAKVRFTADWVMPRSNGTCFVRFPTLQAPRFDPTHMPDEALAEPRAGPGDVIVASTGGQIVNAQASIPPPTDPRIPQWLCTSMAVSTALRNTPTGGSTNCGGFAVFAAPGADAHVGLWLLIDGALIGVAAALFVESAMKFRWPLSHQTEIGESEARTT